MTTFFSVDVETSDVNPWRGGQLLSIGIAPARWTPGQPVQVAEPEEGHYVRIDCSQVLEPLGWYGDIPEDSQTSTYKWWIQQSVEAQAEAWLDRSLERLPALDAVDQCVKYLESIEPQQSQRIFVANPSSFDKMWITYFFAGLEEEPFSHRSLCLRSFRFGIEKDSPWGASREHHHPILAHHAYYDALAQAKDFKDLMQARDNYLPIDIT